MTKSTSWIDNKVLETLLRREENDASIQVISSVTINAVPKGENFGSILMRVSVEYKHEDDAKTIQRSLIVKSMPDGEMMRKHVSESGVFERESRVYHVTLPSVYRLVNERTGVDMEHMGAGALVTDRPDTIILEDLRSIGYKMANRRDGLNLAHSRLAMTTLANFHAISMALHAVEPESIEYYKEAFYLEDKRKFLSDFFEKCFISLAAVVGSWPGFERFEEKVMKIASTSVDRCIELVVNKEGALRVLNHGDYWINNMMFKYDGDKVVSVKMVDFQLVRFASPALDVIYFLNTSLSQHILEEHGEVLIGEYHDSLNVMLKRLKCENLTVSRERLDQELKDKEYFAVIMSCLLSIILADPKDAPDISSVSEQEMEDGKLIESMSKTFAGERFKNAFQRRLLQFEAQGLI